MPWLSGSLRNHTNANALSWFGRADLVGTLSVHQMEENLICCISQALYTWAPGKVLPFPLKRSSTIKMGRRNRAIWLASRSISRKLYKSIQVKMQQVISRWWGDVGDGILHPYLFSVSMTPSLAAFTHKWIVETIDAWVVFCKVIRCIMNAEKALIIELKITVLNDAPRKKTFTCKQCTFPAQLPTHRIRASGSSSVHVEWQLDA